MDLPFCLAEGAGGDAVVELVGLLHGAREHVVEARERIAMVTEAQTQPDDLTAARGHVEHVMRRRFRSRAGRVHRIALALDDVPVERVFDIGRLIRLTP